MPALEVLATLLLAVGGIGVLSMAAYLLAMHWVDWDLVPTGWLPRMLWWRRNAARLLVGSVLLAVLGGLVRLCVQAQV